VNADDSPRSRRPITSTRTKRSRTTPTHRAPASRQRPRLERAGRRARSLASTSEAAVSYEPRGGTRGRRPCAEPRSGSAPPRLFLLAATPAAAIESLNPIICRLDTVRPSSRRGAAGGARRSAMRLSSKSPRGGSSCRMEDAYFALADASVGDGRALAAHSGCSDTSPRPTKDPFGRRFATD